MTKCICLKGLYRSTNMIVNLKRYKDYRIQIEFKKQMKWSKISSCISEEHCSLVNNYMLSSLVTEIRKSENSEICPSFKDIDFIIILNKEKDIPMNERLETVFCSLFSLMKM